MVRHTVFKYSCNIIQSNDLEDTDSQSLQHESIAPAITSQDDESTLSSALPSLHQRPCATTFPAAPEHTSSSATLDASIISSDEREESNTSGSYIILWSVMYDSLISLLQTLSLQRRVIMMSAQQQPQTDNSNLEKTPPLQQAKFLMEEKELFIQRNLARSPSPQLPAKVCGYMIMYARSFSVGHFLQLA